MAIKCATSIFRNLFNYKNWTWKRILYSPGWPYDGLMLTSLALLRNATIQPILQTDDIRSTDPATYDVFTTYEEPTMLQTKLWDIQVCEAPNKLIPQHRGVMREVIR